MKGSKKPVDLLKEWVKLHVTPRVRSTLDRKLNKLLLANDVIEGNNGIQVPPACYDCQEHAYS